MKSPGKTGGCREVGAWSWCHFFYQRCHFIFQFPAREKRDSEQMARWFGQVFREDPAERLEGSGFQ
ncbi:hypothetical protein ABH19_02665 [Leptospirillum sp. Group II 'CF-1']|nr:hypothetical protein ABH19_02665 [Leptospirillum sp. Group II 'CF-1']